MLFAIAILAAVVQPLTSAPQVLIPAAGSTPGVNGTFFRSEVVIVNVSDHDQNIRLQWLPQGVSATSSTTITITSHGALRSQDFVPEILAQSGLGAVLITGVTSSGDPDPTAALWVKSRIWTDQPGTSGTTSQSFDAIPVSAINTTDARFYHLGEFTTGFRVNVGIVNLDPVNAQTFAVINEFTPLPSGGTAVTVPPLSMQQIPFGASPDVLVTNTTPAAQKSNVWITYASTIDNVTGDAWSELGAVGAPGLCCGPIW